MRNPIKTLLSSVKRVSLFFFQWKELVAEGREARATGPSLRPAARLSRGPRPLVYRDPALWCRVLG